MPANVGDEKKHQNLSIQEMRVVFCDYETIWRPVKYTNAKFNTD